MLLYLSSRTWQSGEESEALAEQVAAAIESGMRLILAHEAPGIDTSQERPTGRTRDAIEFDTLLEVGHTPPSLMAAGVYRGIAIPLKGGAHRDVSVALLARAIAEALRDHVGVPTPMQDRLAVASSLWRRACAGLRDCLGGMLRVQAARPRTARVDDSGRGTVIGGVQLLDSHGVQNQVR